MNSTPQLPSYIFADVLDGSPRRSDPGSKYNESVDHALVPAHLHGNSGLIEPPRIRLALIAQAIVLRGNH